MNYITRNEFMDAYENGTLNEFNEKLYVLFTYV